MYIYVDIFFAALGEAILNLLGCLVPFLEYDLLDTLPYSVSVALATFPTPLHREIIDLLCTTLMPVTLGKYNKNYNMYDLKSFMAITLLEI